MQQVNLYTIEFRRDEQSLSARRILQLAGVFALLLLGVEAVAAWKLQSAKQDLQTLEQQERDLNAQLQALRQARPLNEADRLESEVAQLRAEVKRREELKSLIRGQNLGNGSGFSAYLEALARQSSSDLSLTQIRLLDGGDYLELGGWARRPEVVPFYLRQLRREPSFEAVRFGVLGIEEDSESPQLRFDLTRPAEEAS